MYSLWGLQAVSQLLGDEEVRGIAALAQAAKPLVARGSPPQPQAAKQPPTKVPSRATSPAGGLAGVVAAAKEAKPAGKPAKKAVKK